MAKRKKTESPPKWADEKTVIRQMTPELSREVLNRWIPLDLEPIDRFTPEHFKKAGYNPLPVFLIRKPTQMDVIRRDVSVNTQNLQDAEMEFFKKEKLELIEEKKAQKKLANWKQSAEYKRLFALSLADEMNLSCRQFLMGWEEWKDGAGVLIPFRKNQDGTPSKETILVLERAWNTMFAIHMRCQSLTHLSGLEVESFASSPTSVMA